MKKKISLILAMCLMILGLTACGEDPTKIDYNGRTYDELKSECEGTAEMLLGISDEEKEVIIAMSAEEAEQYMGFEKEEFEILVNMLTRWQEATEDVGEYKKLGEFTITKSGKTLTCEQEIIFEERPVLLTCVYTYRNMELEDITVDAVQTLGEKMTNAGLNTLMGMGVVFAVLILISLVIYCFKIFPYLETKLKERKERKAAEKSETMAEAEVAQESIPTTVQDDLELVAVIAAAVAAATGTSTDDFVVRSIKRRF